MYNDKRHGGGPINFPHTLINTFSYKQYNIRCLEKY